MANGPDALAAEHEQFVAFIAQYAEISIAATKGNPPDTYVLAFDLRAYVPSEDGIEVTKPHSIQIRLLPGFPEQPPEVRALTPIYHPAVDEDDGSIDVSVHWDTQPTLPELVEHIAALITGAEYHVPNPANPDAVEWYNENFMELPLDAATYAVPEEEDGGHAPGALEMEFEPAVNVDHDLEAPDPQEYEEQIAEIRELLEKKQLFVLDKQLSALPANLWFPERAEAETLVEAAKQETRRLFEQARELEDEGEFGKAMRYAQAILERIPDHPDAKALVQRLQQSSFITNSLDDDLQAVEDNVVGDTLNAAGALGALGAKGIKTRDAAPRESGDAAAEKGPKLPWLPEDLPIKLIMSAVAGAALFFFILTLMLRDMSNLESVRRGIDQGRLQMQLKQFTPARETLERARAGTNGLTLMFFRKGSLRKQIDAMLASPEFKDGSRDMVEYKGKYLPVATVQALTEMERLEKEAQELIAEQQYEEAQRAYNLAVQRISKVDMPQERTRLEALAEGVGLEKLLRRAREAEEENDLEEAASLYRQTERLLRDNAALGKQYGRRIKAQRDGLELRQALDKVTKALEAGRLEMARDALQQAESLAKRQGTLSPETRHLFDGAKMQLKMGAVLPDAKRAFESKKWQEAARLYQQALALADDSPEEIKKGIRGFLSRLEFTRDVAQVRMTMDAAKTAADRQDWGAAARLQNEALDRLSRGSLAGNPELAALKKEIGNTLAEYRGKLQEVERGRYLEARGMAHLTRRYTTFKEENLGPPKAIFLRREGTRLIYELSSVDRSQGRPTKLVMRFAYDEKNGQWSEIGK